MLIAKQEKKHTLVDFIVFTLVFFILTMCFVGEICWAKGKSNGNTIDIGVLAFRGEKRARSMWQPTATYLSTKLPAYQFRIVPLDLEKMNSFVADGLVDFVLTNPGQYVVLEHRFGITRLVTLRNLRQGKPYTKFGAVIFTRQSNVEIKTLADLNNRSFAAVGKNALGGFQMAWHELNINGIDPFSDFASLEFIGFPQDNVVNKVLAGEVDSGTVRTDVLERMAKSGQINLSAVKVLNPKHHPDFPFLLSTRLYPEWPFAKVQHTPEKLAKKVAMALLGLEESDSASVSSKSAGWTIPLDYTGIHELFKKLKIEPYEKSADPALGLVLKRYWYYLLAPVLVIAFFVFHNYRIKGVVIQRTRQLEYARKELEIDIEERIKVQRELQQSESRLQAILDNTSSIIYMKDSDGRYLMVNHSFERLFKLNNEEIIGKTDEQLFGPKLAEEIRKNDLQVWQNCSVIEFEESIVLNDKLNTYLSVKFPIVFGNGTPIAIGGVSTDITARKETEKELHLYQEHLEEKVLERTTEISRINRELQSFMYSLAHDLRSPLRAITSYSQIVSANIEHQLTEEDKYLFERTIAAAKHMAIMLDNMLELNDINKRELRKEKLDVSEIVENICKNLSQGGSGTFITWSVEPGMSVIADKILFGALLRHLLENAWIYADPSRESRVEIYQQNQDGQTVFVIKDNGIGFDMQYAKKIMEPFQRLHRMNEYPGTGMGLAAVMRILERHNGSIWVDANPGAGATFYFTIGEP